MVLSLQAGIYFNNELVYLYNPGIPFKNKWVYLYNPGIPFSFPFYNKRVYLHITGIPLIPLLIIIGLFIQYWNSIHSTVNNDGFIYTILE